MLETEKEKDLDNLLSNENEIEKKKKIRLIIAGVLALLIMIVIIIIKVSTNKKDKKNSDVEQSDEPSDETSDLPSEDTSDIPTENPSYKLISIEAVPLPEGIIYDSYSIHSKAGSILFTYKYENDSESNKTYIGVMDEEGSSI